MEIPVARPPRVVPSTVVLVLAAGLAAVLGLALLVVASAVEEVAAPEVMSPQVVAPVVAHPVALDDDGRFHGTTGVAASGRAFFRVSSNTGCTGCSTVWRRTPTGTWRRLHDFGREAYGRRVDDTFGPVDRVHADRSGRHLWVLGRSFWASDDAGRTWREIVTGPAHRAVAIAATRTHVFVSTASPTFARWVAPIGSRRWTRIDRNGGHGVVPLGDRVAFPRYGEGLSDPHLELTRDGVVLTRLDLPCPGETSPSSIGTTLYVACPGRGPTVVWRSDGGARWVEVVRVRGHLSPAIPLAADRVLLPGRPDLLVVGEGRPLTVDAPDASGVAVVGRQVIATGYRANHVSRDGGRTWRVSDRNRVPRPG